MKSVTITVNEDGTFMVSSGIGEAPEMAQPDMMAEQAPEQAGQLAGSIDEALDMARQMLQDDGRSEDQAAMDGYNKGRPATTAKPGLQQVFGE